MDSASPRIGFIGVGRVASALTRALARAGQRVVSVFDRVPAKSGSPAAAIPGCRSALTMQDAADASDMVFLSVSDDAIASVASSIHWRPGQAVIHCSGAAELDVLEAARGQGARTGSFHPLQLFSDADVAAAGLSRCAIALDAEPVLFIELERLVDALGARPLRVPPGKRAAYHAASHYAAAFLCVLLKEGEKIMGALGMDESEAGRGLQALARGTLDAVEHSGPAQAMAGVYSRGDVGTAARHIEALSSIGPGVLGLYSALAERSIQLALEAGRIDPAKADALRRLLAQ